MRKSKVRPGTGRPHWEIQIHPSDIQKGVRYLFLSRRQISLVATAACLFLLFLIWGVALLPTAISGILDRREYRTLEATRTKLGERLTALTLRLTELKEEGALLHLKMNKIYLAYGLSNDVSIGQGGYPFRPTEAVPDSIYREKIAEAMRLETTLREQVQVLKTFVTEIQTFEAATKDQSRSTPSVSPLRGDDFVLTSPFGYRKSPFTQKWDFHAGIDLAAPMGSPIYAPADGQVYFAGQYPQRQSVSWWRYGKLISIRHSRELITLFGHCDDIKVRAGQKVRQGEIIGTVGDSGWSTSPHLHYEVRRRDKESEFRPVDPRIYILDHRWSDEEQILVRARRAPEPKGFEPLPRRIGR